MAKTDSIQKDARARAVAFLWLAGFALLSGISWALLADNGNHPHVVQFLETVCTICCVLIALILFA